MDLWSPGVRTAISHLDREKAAGISHAVAHIWIRPSETVVE